MTAPLMPKATAVWLVENTTLTFKQIGIYCELHELEVQAIADGDVALNIVGLNPVTGGQLTTEEISRCEKDKSALLVGVEPERNVKVLNSKNKKVLSPSQRNDKPAAILWILRNCPEIIDSQICKLIGTTKPTIAVLRSGTYRDMVNLRPKNPVAVGLCKEKELDEAIAVSKKWKELKSKPKVAKKKVSKRKTPTQKTSAKKMNAEKKTLAKLAKIEAKKSAKAQKQEEKLLAKKAAKDEKAAAKLALKKVAKTEKSDEKKAAKKAEVKAKVDAKKEKAKAAAKAKADAKKEIAKAKLDAKKEKMKAKLAAKKDVKKKTAKKKTTKKAK